MKLCEKVKYNRTAFCEKVNQIADKLATNPLWLLQVIYIESRFNPKAVNPKTDAVGLLQFTPGTRQWLGVTKQQLLNMKAVEQLDYVYKFLYAWQRAYNLKFDSFISLYMTVFYPAAVVNNYHKKLTYVIGSEKGQNYAAIIARNNPDFDLNNDGYISVAEIQKYYRKLFKTFDYDIIAALAVGFIFSL